MDLAVLVVGDVTIRAGDGLLIGETFIVVDHLWADGTVWIRTPSGYLDWISRTDAHAAKLALRARVQ
jgi:hypothetical protein